MSFVASNGPQITFAGNYHWIPHASFPKHRFPHHGRHYWYHGQIASANAAVAVLTSVLQIHVAEIAYEAKPTFERYAPAQHTSYEAASAKLLAVGRFEARCEWKPSSREGRDGILLVD